MAQTASIEDATLVRRDELDTWRRLAAAAHDGDPKTVFISGPAGSGKGLDEPSAIAGLREAVRAGA